MKIKTVFIIGLILSLIALIILANKEEGGDINAISMYFVVFLIPVLLIVGLNTIFIKFISTFKNRFLKILISFLPLAIFIVLCQFKNLTIPLIDGNLLFLALTAAIAIGITNILWVVGVYQQKSTS